MRLFLFVPVAVCLLHGCKRGESKPPAEAHETAESHHDEKEHEELPRQVSLSGDAAQAAGVQTQVVKRSALVMTASLPGEISAEPDRSAQLSSTTAGRLDQVAFNEGVMVKKGDVLAVLQVPDVGRLRGAQAASAAKAKASRANAERLRSLKESGLGSEQAVVDAEAEARAQEAEARAIGDQLGAIGVKGPTGGGYLVPLRAPISGVVVSRNAVVGQPISADHVLATVIDLSEVWFLGRVFEKDLSRLRVGAKAEVKLNAFPEDRLPGVVEHLGQQIDEVARTLTARIRLKNEGLRLRLGLFGSAQVEVAEPSQSPPQVIVPRSAVTDIGGRNIVFVKAKDGDFVLHEVTLGDSALGHVQVVSGLTEGEEVVTQGVFTLKSLVLKSTLSEEEH